MQSYKNHSTWPKFLLTKMLPVSKQAAWCTAEWPHRVQPHALQMKCVLLTSLSPTISQNIIFPHKILPSVKKVIYFTTEIKCRILYILMTAQLKIHLAWHCTAFCLWQQDIIYSVPWSKLLQTAGHNPNCCIPRIKVTYVGYPHNIKYKSSSVLWNT